VGRWGRDELEEDEFFSITYLSMTEVTHKSQSGQFSFVKVAVALALITTWVTLWGSRTDLPYKDIDLQKYFSEPGSVQAPIVAKAGFPFVTFYYPLTPLGSDIPPDGSIFPFALNTAIYLGIWLVLPRLLPKRFHTVNFQRASIYFSSIICVIGLFLTILAFD